MTQMCIPTTQELEGQRSKASLGYIAYLNKK